MRVYVASSWRNAYQPKVVEILRASGAEVYDFRNPGTGGPPDRYAGGLDGGFHWSNIDPRWESWSPDEYRANLRDSALAIAGFTQDYNGMLWCNLCLLVQPCGRSAHLELGWCAGAGKQTAIYFPDGVSVEPELMARIADKIIVGESELREIFGEEKP